MQEQVGRNSTQPTGLVRVGLPVSMALLLVPRLPVLRAGGKGGSDQAGMTTAVYLYRMAFDFNDFGAASAMSWLLFVVVAVLTWVTNRAFRQRGQ